MWIRDRHGAIDLVDKVRTLKKAYKEGIEVVLKDIDPEEYDWMIIDAYNRTVSDCLLYTSVDNVSDYSSYQISKDAYNYATGENVLRLILNLSNGKTVEKTTKVFVNYVVSMEQRVKQLDHATQIMLNYQYDKAHPVEVPSTVSYTHLSRVS